MAPRSPRALTEMFFLIFEANLSCPWPVVYVTQSTVFILRSEC